MKKTQQDGGKLARPYCENVMVFTLEISYLQIPMYYTIIVTVMNTLQYLMYAVTVIEIESITNKIGRAFFKNMGREITKIEVVCHCQPHIGVRTMTKDK